MMRAVLKCHIPFLFLCTGCGYTSAAVFLSWYIKDVAFDIDCNISQCSLLSSEHLEQGSLTVD